MSKGTQPAVARIYSLADPRDLEVRYIGMTVQPLKARLSGHMSDHRGNTRKVRWISVLRNAGLKPIITELEEVAVEERAEAEQKWIACFRTAGARLVNATDGGIGTLGRKLTAEERMVVSRVHKGKKISAEHRRIVGEAATRRWAEYRTNGGTLSDESRARLSAAAKARNPQPHSAETKARLSASKREAWALRKATGADITVRRKMREGITQSGTRAVTGLGTVLVDPDGTIHGTSGYNYGCRCDVCVTAQASKRELRSARERKARLSLRQAPRFCEECAANISHRHLKARYCEVCGSDVKVQARLRHRRKMNHPPCLGCDADMSQRPTQAKYCEFCRPPRQTKRDRPAGIASPIGAI